MRRGHPGIGGWRNENPRHFRPRTGTPTRFRPPRLYPMLDTARFPPPGPRHHGAPHPYNTHSAHSDEHGLPDHHDRNNFRNQNHHQNNPRQQDRGHQPRSRQPYPYAHSKLKQDDRTSPYKHSPNFYEDVTVEPYQHINSLGDVDHRQLHNPSRSQDSYGPHKVNPWANPPLDQRNFYEDKNSHKYFRYHESERQPIESNKLPSLDYTGHRPPSSDYYGSTSTTIVNNNNAAFSRSVDDTVDIIRKRLMNRNDPQTSQDASEIQMPNEPEAREADQNTQQEQPTKKRIQRQRQNVKSNCDKMKTNIVHQLFKMDKDKMHKLMDNPSSSSKFEYAISSLITESQISLNRHMRSVAEKSLVSSSTDFIQNDNNTIYEDTFMKQMQCLLDPQDTVLLEDIKPLVMAELSKVLQLEDFEQRYDMEDQNIHHTPDMPSRDDQHHYPLYENYQYDEYPDERYYDEQGPSSNYEDAHTVHVIDSTVEDNNCNTQVIKSEENCEPETPFERHIEDRRQNVDGLDRRQSVDGLDKRQNVDGLNRRQSVDELDKRQNLDGLDRMQSVGGLDRRQSVDGLDKRQSVDRQDRKQSADSQRTQQRKCTDKPVEERFIEESLPLFDTNPEVMSEDEDTFAELDKQYHVAVDFDFLDNDSARTTPNHIQPPETNAAIKNEINSQLLSLADSALKSFSATSQIDREIETNMNQIKQEVEQSPDFPKENSTPAYSDNVSHRLEPVSVKQEFASRCKDIEREADKSNISNISKTSQLNSRKRSIDQRPSHRKEKRKKSESSSSDIAKHDSHSLDSRHSKSTEKCNEVSKSYDNVLYSKDDSSKESSKDKSKTDKNYSDKYVKRKESKKSKDNESHKKRRSSSSSQIILSPKDSSHTHVSPAKSDAKTKLKPIDMFVEQPKKASVHQAHRNTAPIPATTPKAAEENKPKPVTPTHKTVQTKHASTQVIKRVINKESQTFETKTVSSKYCQTTEKTKLLSKGVQTPISLNKLHLKSENPFERMKEIDMLIQELLKEKFTLYNNLECKDATPTTVSMTVVNVNPEDIETDANNKDEMVIIEENYNPDSEIKQEDSDTINLDPDSIANDFTNIPVEELEQIALETIAETSVSSKKVERRTSRQKALQQKRMNSASPSSSTSSKKSTRKAKPPNISLIEQITTEERPLDDIISLNDYEEPAPSKKKKATKSKSKKKVSKKAKVVKEHKVDNYDLRECSVLLIQTDITKFIKQPPRICEEVISLDDDHTSEALKEEPFNLRENREHKDSEIPKNPSEHAKRSIPAEVVEEIVNDLQFDMLDVSEDIIIGESCEIKDKDASDQSIPISEELILDNSQSSADHVVGAEAAPVENECRMYDYSTDEKLRRDSLTVTGHADAVLAIECIDNGFLAACLDGNVYHFNNDGHLINTMRGSNLAVTCLTIVKEKYGTTVYTGSLDSRIRYYDLDTGLEKGPECNVLSPIQTMDRAWDTVFVGTRTGFVLQFECKNNMLIPVSTVKFSEQAILALRAMKEGPRKVLLVASRSENVTVKDAQTGLLLRTLIGPMMTVYTLLFEDGKVYCGTSSHQIHVFDYASGTHTGCHEGGKGAVCLRATGGLLFAGCYDGCVYVYRDGDTRPLAQLRGPGLMLLSLAVVGSKIIAGYKDRSLYIWKIPLSILQEMIL